VIYVVDEEAWLNDNGILSAFAVRFQTDRNIVDSCIDGNYAKPESVNFPSGTCIMDL